VKFAEDSLDLLRLDEGPRIAVKQEAGCYARQFFEFFFTICPMRESGTSRPLLM
jgi:hypothetical protein